MAYSSPVNLSGETWVTPNHHESPSDPARNARPELFAIAIPEVDRIPAGSPGRSDARPHASGGRVPGRPLLERVCQLQADDVDVVLVRAADQTVGRRASRILIDVGIFDENVRPR